MCLMMVKKTMASIMVRDSRARLNLHCKKGVWKLQRLLIKFGCQVLKQFIIISDSKNREDQNMRSS